MRKKQETQLVDRMRHAYDLAQERKYDEAIEQYRQLLAFAKGHRIDSPYLLWCMAIAFDNNGDLEMAFQHISEAMKKDPLAMPVRHSFDIIANRLRAALADDEREANDASTPRLYELLARAGEADVHAHLAMVRYQLATGKVDDAAVLVDAVTRLWPASEDAWAAKAAVARAAGDEEAATKAEIEAAALRTADVAYAVPGTAQA